MSVNLQGRRPGRLWETADRRGFSVLCTLTLEIRLILTYFCMNLKHCPKRLSCIRFSVPFFFFYRVSFNLYTKAPLRFPQVIPCMLSETAPTKCVHVQPAVSSEARISSCSLSVAFGDCTAPFNSCTWPRFFSLDSRTAGRCPQLNETRKHRSLLLPLSVIIL